MVDARAGFAAAYFDDVSWFGVDGGAEGPPTEFDFVVAGRAVASSQGEPVVLFSAFQDKLQALMEASMTVAGVGAGEDAPHLGGSAFKRVHGCRVAFGSR